MKTGQKWLRYRIFLIFEMVVVRHSGFSNNNNNNNNDRLTAFDPGQPG